MGKGHGSGGEHARFGGTRGYQKWKRRADKRRNTKSGSVGIPKVIARGKKELFNMLAGSFRNHFPSRQLPSAHGMQQRNGRDRQMVARKCCKPATSSAARQRIEAGDFSEGPSSKTLENKNAGMDKDAAQGNGSPISSASQQWLDISVDPGCVSSRPVRGGSLPTDATKLQGLPG